ncbi:MAG: hypothetical protein DRJ38_03845 [Thermoprotei archaeon]|nr:MAG: hypothetical protein DRJ38_03845 [Thermoprotei archaeon]
MKIMKTLGYTLLTMGLVLIFYALASVLLVFMGVSKPPQLIVLNDIKINLPMGSSLTLLESDVLTSLMNLSLWYILMFFVLAAGEKIASIGIKILKELSIKIENQI